MYPLILTGKKNYSHGRNSESFVDKRICLLKALIMVEISILPHADTHPVSTPLEAGILSYKLLKNLMNFDRLDG